MESEGISVGGAIAPPIDFLSQDETNPDPVSNLTQGGPDSSIILDSGEIVRESRTNPYTILKPKNEILVHIRTNYSQLVERVPSELVRRVCTIYGQSEQATRIINYILENPSFLVPTMRYELELKKRTIYQILQNLYPWVKKTDTKIPHPDPSTKGPYPHVYIIDGEDLLDHLGEARKSYYDTLEQHDPVMKHAKSFEAISARIAHQLWGKGMKYIEEARVLELCKEIPKEHLHPRDRKTVVKQVTVHLAKLREGSP